MLRRTTVYLNDSEIETLKQISFIQNVSMAELIRRGIQRLCKTFSEEQKDALAALSQIKKESSKARISEKAAMAEAVKLQREVRRGRKKSRR